MDQNANLLARYTPGAGIDEPLSEVRSGATSYYEQDGLGSVTSLSAGGVLSNSYVYDSFGNLTSSSGTVTNPFQYTGRDYDPETGLRYYRARYYDSMQVNGQPQVTYTYDNATRLTQISQGSSSTGLGYDNANRRTSLPLPNNVVVSYSYDNDSRLTSNGYSDCNLLTVTTPAGSDFHKKTLQD